jgi:hypothetical protein
VLLNLPKRQSQTLQPTIEAYVSDCDQSRNPSSNCLPLQFALIPTDMPRISHPIEATMNAEIQFDDIPPVDPFTTTGGDYPV